jgi:hypothetical protein
MGRWADQPLVRRARCYRRPNPSATPLTYEWARTTARGLCVVGDLADALGVSSRWARRLLLRSRYPRTLLVRKWMDPTTNIRYRRTLWVFPQEVGQLIAFDYMARYPKRYGVALPPAWRQRTWRLRRRLRHRYPVSRENTA